MDTKIQTKWYQLNGKEVLNLVSSGPKGLSSDEVKKRQEKEGMNVLPQPEGLSPLKILLSQLKSPLVYILLIAAAISFFVGESFDVVVIFAVVVINTVVGFWQEYKADRAIAELNKLVEDFVDVERNGRKKRILAKELVVGDIVLLESGDKISADARLLQVNDFNTNEASLTGESLPVNKGVRILKGEHGIGDRVNMVHMGTIVARGRARAVVIAIGVNTEIGKIAQLVKETEDEKTPLQLQMEHVSKFLTYVVGAAALLIFIIGLVRGLPFEEILITTVALAVAAIPEGLLVALTLVLVFGMKKILKKKALVRKLVAAETLGSVSVICSDKTGTITLGKMLVDQVLVGGQVHMMKAGDKTDITSGSEAQHMLALRAMALCNNSYITNPDDKFHEWEIVGDSTDAALLLAASQAGLDQQQLNLEYGRLDEIPFNEVYKYHATLNYISDKNNAVFVKGAPESIIPMCNRYQKGDRKFKIDKERKEQIKKEYEDLTKQGLRVLALAYEYYPSKVNSFKDLVSSGTVPRLKDLVFIGWVGLKDPVRPEVPEAFQTIKDAGIRIVIVTGDHKFTVQAIIKELGFDVPDERIMLGVELDKLSDEELYQVIEDIDIFARVEPKDKLRIVQAWKRKGEVVAMLGDGVNDAPALKAADIGVAVGEATDVAKETADLILIDGNFKVIEEAIREGRAIFDNIRKVFLYLMADSFTEIVLISLALFAGYPLPLAAVQILWINIMSDGLPDLALTMEPAEKDVMAYPPRKRDERIVNNEMKVLIALITIVSVTAAMGVFIYILNKTGDLAYARTLVFTTFAVDSIIYVFSVRSLRQPIWKTNFFSNKFLLLAVGISLLLQVAVIYIPFLSKFMQTTKLNLQDWGIVFSIGLATLAVREVFKWIYWHKRRMKVV